jgi:uncharacterized protein
MADGLLHIRVHAPATEGKANKALLKFLSDRLHVPHSDIQIERGANSRYKVISVAGQSVDDVWEQLRA